VCGLWGVWCLIALLTMGDARVASWVQSWGIMATKGAICSTRRFEYIFWASKVHFSTCRFSSFYAFKIKSSQRLSTSTFDIRIGR
jgi:hypothetical protein